MSALLAGPLLAACEVNPATGRQSFTGLMSPAEEREVGRREHPNLLKAFGGAYPDPAVQAYVSQVGQRVLAASEIADQPVTFTVLNSDVINAMALPGYVYITRGLLALANTEAELASVLAHELGHIAARHIAERQSSQMAAGIGVAVLGALGAAAGVPGGVGDAVAYGTQAYLQGFSRDQELEADGLGMRYMGRVGYDLRGAVAMFESLDAHHRLEAEIAGDPARADAFNIMQTHPRTVDRIRQAAATAGVAPEGVANREALLARLDGMVFGDDPKEGVRRGRSFLHPALAIAFEVPPDFVLHNTPSAVIATGPGNARIVFDTASPARARAAPSPGAYLTRDWGANAGLRDVETITVNGMAGATGHTRINTRSGPRDARLVAIRESPERIYRLLFLTDPRSTERQSADLRRTTYSLRKLSAAEAAAVRPLRLRLHTVRPGDTVEGLARGMPVPSHAEAWLRVLNSLGPNEPLAQGERIKLVGD